MNTENCIYQKQQKLFILAKEYIQKKLYERSQVSSNRDEYRLPNG